MKGHLPLIYWGEDEEPPSAREVYGGALLIGAALVGTYAMFYVTCIVMGVM